MKFAAEGFVGRARLAAVGLCRGDEVLLGGLVIAAVVRLLLLPFFSDPLNYYGFSLTANLVAQGQNPWVAIASDPALSDFNPWGYPPLFLLPTLGALALSGGNGYLFGLLIRLPLQGASLLTALFLHRSAMAVGVGPERARALALVYALNPFVVLVDSIWGTNDPWPILFVAGAVYYLVRDAPRYDLAALLLGLGIAFKIYPGIFVPLAIAGLAGTRARLRFFCLCAVPALVTFGPVLVASPVEFLTTVTGFTVGRASGGLSASLSVWWVLQDVFGYADMNAVTAVFVLYVILLVVLSVQVARKRLSLLSASTAIVLGLFLVAPRINQNYFLWAIPFVTLAAGTERWPLPSKLCGEFSWIPLLTTALIYNGAAGVTGIFYWGLVAGFPPEHPYLWVPFWTLRNLVSLFVVMLAVGALGLLVGSSKHWETLRTFGAAGSRAARFFHATATRAVPTLLAGVIAMSLLAAGVAALQAPFLPGDFGSYQVAGGQVTVVDDFQSGLVGFIWDFNGVGRFQLDPSPPGTLTLDTKGIGGNAYIERLIPNRPVDVVLTAAVLQMEGSPGLIQMARVPAGWVGVLQTSSPPAQARYAVVYHDEITNNTHELGSVTLGGFFRIEMTLAPDMTVVRHGGAEAIASGRGNVERIQIGQPDVFQNAGGRQVIDRVELSWASTPGMENPLLGGAIVGSCALVMAAPVWWWRRHET